MHQLSNLRCSNQILLINRANVDPQKSCLKAIFYIILSYAQTILTKMQPQITALIITVTLAFVGYFATYITNLILARRKERLDFINKAINDFYGPLYVVTHAGDTAYNAFVTKLGKANDPNLEKPLTSEEFAEWRIWIINVFMPMNEWLEKLLLGNAYLVQERDMPECILLFITHVSAYKTVIKKWESGDYSEHFSVIDYPEELLDYAAKAYRSLKDEQLRLIGKLKYQA